MTNETSLGRFCAVLEQALQSLYDPAALMRSGLIEWLNLSSEHATPMRLQNLIASEIDLLKPAAGVPADTPGWRYYHILTQRYLEQLSTDEIARNLAVSGRHVRRLHPQALDALASQLASRHGLHPPEHQDSSVAEGDEMGRTREFELVSERLGNAPVRLDRLVAGTVSVVMPLAREHGITIETQIAHEVGGLTLAGTPLRHALLTVLSELLRSLRQAKLSLTAAIRGEQIHITLSVVGAATATQSLTDAIEVAGALLSVAGGDIARSTDSGWMTIVLRSPVTTRKSILIIDDNEDALRLFERFMVDSPFRMVGLSAPERAIEIALEVGPAAVLLDLMLPGMDGWELLAHLRELPELSSTPVWVCSILPQEELALALGAAGLLRKPVSRETLLQTLSHLLA